MRMQKSDAHPLNAATKIVYNLDTQLSVAPDVQERQVTMGDKSPKKDTKKPKKVKTATAK